MKFLKLTIFFLILIAGFGLAESSQATTVTAVSGIVTNGQNIVVAGSGFGTKSPAAPLLWENFEWGSDETLINGNNGWSQVNLGQNPGTRIDTAQKYGQGTNSSHYYVTLPAGSEAPESQEFGYIHKNFGEQSTLYASYQCRYNITNASGGGWKLARLNNWSYASQYNSAPTMGVTYNSMNEYDLFYYNGSGITETYPGSVSLNADIWNRFEYYYVVSTTNGVVNTTVNYVNRSSTAPNTASGSELPDSFISPHQMVNFIGGSGGGRIDVWCDDIYVDNTRARVEICNSSTWAARTHCELQIPSAWSDSSVTVTINQGTFISGAAYLYVTDATGAVNSNGYALTWNFGGGDTTAPGAPSGLTVQ